MNLEEAKADGERLMEEILSILEHVPAERSLSVLIHVSGCMIAQHYDIKELDNIIKMLSEQVKNCVYLMIDEENKKDLH